MIGILTLIFSLIGLVAMAISQHNLNQAQKEINKYLNKHK